jgi:hypothetical protein
MTFIVQADSRRSGEGTFTVRKTTRKDAFETAVGLMGQGMDGVIILDEETGRTYKSSEFADFISGLS